MVAYNQRDLMTPEQIFADLVAEGDVPLNKLNECAARPREKTFIRYGEHGATPGRSLRSTFFLPAQSRVRTENLVSLRGDRIT
jgi:hypothetical protein